jgi:crossover junction endodeoxyribonuclease RuvC
MLVLGIDPGTATTGYGLITETSEGGLKAVEFGAIVTPASVSMPERLLLLYQRLNEIILLHQPDSGAVEKLFFQRNVTTAISVGQARGVALLALANNGKPVTEYTPLEVKQAVCGYGAAEKHQVQRMVRALLGLSQDPQPDDAADALAIAICHINSSSYREVISHSGK